MRRWRRPRAFFRDNERSFARFPRAVLSSPFVANYPRVGKSLADTRYLSVRRGHPGGIAGSRAARNDNHLFRRVNGLIINRPRDRGRREEATTMMTPVLSLSSADRDSAKENERVTSHALDRPKAARAACCARN